MFKDFWTYKQKRTEAKDMQLDPIIVTSPQSDDITAILKGI